MITQESPIQGIYHISSKDRRMLYVGQSKNIAQRFIDHKRQMEKGIHPNKGLQDMWNEYGESGIQFEIKEIVDDARILIKRERDHIIELKNGTTKLLNHEAAWRLLNPISLEPVSSNWKRKLHQRSKDVYFIAIPKNLADFFNWHGGDDIEITPDTKKQTLTLRKK
jgi:hypothetical protein